MAISRILFRLLIPVGCLLLAGFSGLAPHASAWQTQYPGQYPPTQYPGQYPPGQYPPGQYPPGGYPPNRVPTPIPGVGVEVPTIKLPTPKKKSEGDKKKGGNDKQLTIDLSNVSGTLRELEEKHLLLETAAHGVLRFRLLAKTEFRDKQGEPVRDSLLKPGDQLQLQVNADDVETALRVTLVRKGTADERKRAEAPVDAAEVKTLDEVGEGEEAEGARPTLAGSEAPVNRSATVEREGAPSERPQIRRRQPGEYQQEQAKIHPPDEEPVTVASAEPAENIRLRVPGADPTITAAREAAAEFTDSLPNYQVQQLTTRYYSATNPPDWRAVDIVSADVVVQDGKEDYRNIRINGRESKRPPEESGSWSTGEFALTLEDILSPTTGADFEPRGNDVIVGRNAAVYRYSVEQPRSHWRLIHEGQSYSPAYKGAIWIDQATKRVLRIEQRSASVPEDFPFDKAEVILDYDFVRINNKIFLLPVRAENLLCQRGTLNCSRNVIEFRNYRKFEAESEIRYEGGGK
jgi:hypothetical protein